jgi:hypothetical protein
MSRHRQNHRALLRPLAQGLFSGHATIALLQLLQKARVQRNCLSYKFRAVVVVNQRSDKRDARNGARKRRDSTS